METLLRPTPMTCTMPVAVCAPRRWLAWLVVLGLVLGSLMQPVQAALISAESVARQAAPADGTPDADRARQVERIQLALQRADVQAELQRLGVPPEQALARVHALTDAEVASLADRVDQLPAGGVIGAILLVFFVLLLTDILGFTKVFPFTRTVR